MGFGDGAGVFDDEVGCVEAFLDLEVCRVGDFAEFDEDFFAGFLGGELLVEVALAGEDALCEGFEGGGDADDFDVGEFFEFGDFFGVAGAV